MQTASSEPVRRDAVLDGLRGVAIAMVLVVHCFEFKGGAASLMANAIVRSCWLGVDLFFVLSGFLITRILIETRDRPGYFKNFYARRALRIFPAYYLYLMLAFVLAPRLVERLGDTDFAGWSLASVLYLQNIKMALDGAATPWRGLDHLWSLAVEEQFYLLWPLLVWVVPKPRLATLCLAMIGAAWVGKASLVAFHDWPMAGYVLMPTRMDALAAGAWVAVRLNDPTAARFPRLPASVVAGAAALLAVVFVRDHGLRLYGAARIASITSCAALVFAAVVYALMHRGWQPRVLLSTPLQTLGRYSYGIYLIHIFGIELVQVGIRTRLEPALGFNGAILVSAAATIAVVVGAAALMFHLYEQPFLRLKDRFVPAARPHIAADPAATLASAQRPD